MKKMSFAIFLLIAGLAVVLPGCVAMQIERKAPQLGRIIEVDGARIHIVELGAENGIGKPPLVLIHGASVNLRDMQLALGDALSETHRVILVDRPGRGYSTRPDDGWRLETQAMLIHDAVAELGVEDPVIVGQSLGGAVALAYALKYQDEMAGLVLLAPVSHEWPGGVAWYNKVSDWPAAGFLLRRLVIPVYGPLAAKGGVEKSFAPDDAPENYYEQSGLALLFRPRDFKSNAADLARLKPQIVEMSRRYGDIHVPTAILTGTSDTTVSPKLHSMQLAGEIDGASLELLPDTGHALHHAETERVVAAILRIAGERTDLGMGNGE